MRRQFQFALLLLPLFLTEGCTTYSVWSDRDFDEWKEPADDPNLRLFDAKPEKDFLVVYDEYSERKGSIHTCAYFLNENRKRILEKRAPHFVSTNLTAGLPALPVFPHMEILPTNREPSLYAILAADNESFTLYSGRAGTNYDLPFYNDGIGKYERMAVTPITVTADLTVIGGVAGLLIIYELGEAGTSFSVP